MPALRRNGRVTSAASQMVHERDAAASKGLPAHVPFSGHGEIRRLAPGVRYLADDLSQRDWAEERQRMAPLPALLALAASC